MTEHANAAVAVRGPKKLGARLGARLMTLDDHEAVAVSNALSRALAAELRTADIHSSAAARVDARETAAAIEKLLEVL